MSGAGARLPAPARRISRPYLAVAIGCGLLVGAGIAVGTHALVASSSRPGGGGATGALHGPQVWPAGARPAPAIATLRDQNGRPFSLASLRGRTVAIAFFDSHCTQACPLEGRALTAAERPLPPAERPDLVVVSVNPLDSPASTARAARSWGLAAVAPWHWLMGSRRQLAPIWRKYGIYVAPRPVDGDITHTEALYLIDRRGDERSAYLYPFAPRFVTADLRALARAG